VSDFVQVVKPFTPVNGPNASTIVVVATASSVQATLPQPPNGGLNAPDNASASFSIQNTSTTLTVFVAFGDATHSPTATVSSGTTPGSYPILPLTNEIITVYGHPTLVAVIGSGAGPTNVYVTPGFGAR
jgi:hypothetical protein